MLRKVLCILVVAVALPTLSQASDLTGQWLSSRGGKYYLTQKGNHLMWYGEDKPDQPGWSNVFSGFIRDNTITGTWMDVPKGHTTGQGKLTLQVTQQGNVIVATDKSDSLKDLKLERVKKIGAEGPPTPREQPSKDEKAAAPLKAPSRQPSKDERASAPLKAPSRPSRHCSISGKATGSFAYASKGCSIELYGPDDKNKHFDTTRFDASGNYRFDSLPAGRYWLSVNCGKIDAAWSAHPDEHSIDVRGETSEINFEFK